LQKKALCKEVFENIVINRDVLSVVIVDCQDVLVEETTYTYRKIGISSVDNVEDWLFGKRSTLCCSIMHSLGSERLLSCT